MYKVLHPHLLQLPFVCRPATWLVCCAEVTSKYCEGCGRSGCCVSQSTVKVVHHLSVRCKRCVCSSVTCHIHVERLRIHADMLVTRREHCFSKTQGSQTRALPYTKGKKRASCIAAADMLASTHTHTHTTPHIPGFPRWS
jgi:hypothetical protein